jgi:hypothetical protein
MMRYRIVIFISLMLIIGGQFFCHADELRDYICIVEARSLTRRITGSGSGFVYVAEDGTNYIYCVSSWNRMNQFFVSYGGRRHTSV